MRPCSGWVGGASRRASNVGRQGGLCGQQCQAKATLLFDRAARLGMQPGCSSLRWCH